MSQVPYRLRYAARQLLAKYVHEVLVNRLGGLSLPRKSVVRLTDRPDMTLNVYRGRKTTTQQQRILEIAAKKTVPKFRLRGFIDV